MKSSYMRHSFYLIFLSQGTRGNQEWQRLLPKTMDSSFQLWARSIRNAQRVSKQNRSMKWLLLQATCRSSRCQGTSFFVFTIGSCLLFHVSVALRSHYSRLHHYVTQRATTMPLHSWIRAMSIRACQSSNDFPT